MPESRVQRGFQMDYAYERMLDSLSEAVSFISSSLRFQFVNSAMATALEKSKSEVIDHAIFDILGFDAQKRVTDPIQQALDGKNSECAGWIRLGQETSLGAIRFTPHFDHDGKVNGLFMNAVVQFKTADIPSPAQTHNYPYLSDQQLIELNHRIGLGYWRLEVSSQRLSFSEDLKEEWKYDQSIPIDTMDCAIGFIYKDDQPRVKAKFDAALKNGTSYEVEYRMLLPNDEFMWVESRAKPQFDENGKLDHFLGTVHDITKYKAAMEFIAESEKRFRALADFLPQIIWTADPQGRVDYFNQKWLDYTGCKLQTTLNHGWQSYIHPDDLPRAIELWQDSLETCKPFEYEFRIQRASDHSYRWHLVRGLPVRDSGDRVVRWIGTNTDIHEHSRLLDELRKATKEAEKATESKSAFLANMSHEIRTPLAAIIGFTNLLSDTSISDEIRLRYLSVVERNSKSLSILINDILDISKFEAGKFAVECIEFSLDAVLEEVVSIFIESCFEKKLGLDVKIDPGTDLRLLSDPARLRQILINIVGNAVKFTNHGAISIRVSSERKGAGLNEYKIVVKDSGVGLTHDQAVRLFKPFSQADESTTRKFGGSGLGLTLSRRLAQALGGDVRLEEFEIDQGCTFSICIEAAPVLGKETIPNMAPRGSETFLFDDLPFVPGHLRALLAEDAFDNQFLITEVLSKCGIHVEIAANGMEAIEKAVEGDHHFVLMDMQMPVLDGFEATRRLRKLGYSKPIIALTALAMDDDRVRVAECGCDTHLIKPIDFMNLVQTIMKLTT